MEVERIWAHCSGTMAG